MSATILRYMAYMWVRDMYPKRCPSPSSTGSIEESVQSNRFMTSSIVSFTESVASGCDISWRTLKWW